MYDWGAYNIVHIIFQVGDVLWENMPRFGECLFSFLIILVETSCINSNNDSIGATPMDNNLSAITVIIWKNSDEISFIETGER